MRSSHWESIYREKSEDQMSWHTGDASNSLSLICQVAPDLDSRILDVGAGTSRLIDELLGAGYQRITLLDIAEPALDLVRRRLGVRAASVTFVAQDLLLADELGTFDVWHDRALFHFLTKPSDQDRYLRLALRSVVPGGHLIVSAFALDGPETCSGLPVQRYDGDLLARAFGNGFELVQCSRSVHSTPWQSVQPFTIALFRRLP